MTNPFGMTDEETLECMGPSWADMSEAARLSYPHAAGDELPAPEPEAEPVRNLTPRALTPRALAARARLAALTGTDA